MTDTDLTIVTDRQHPVALSADQIADALGQPRPTAQQRAIIESPLEPALVIAGAGSGKTETMSNRVLWLLANGKVQAGEVLGLTFTRKAAGELAARIRTRIGQLAEKGLVPHSFDPLDPPVVATYNSFANSIYSDHAVLIGREADSAVLGEASAWQLARSVVLNSDDERLPDLERNVDPVTKAVLALSSALSENIADPDEVRVFAERFAALEELPNGTRFDYKDAVKFIRNVGALPVLLDLAKRFAEVKLERGFVQYSDQVALALEIVRRVPKVRDELRGRFKVVLLDEYQDTSTVQTWLLSELFAGHAVMAVGDPNQSIYGWRGASAANLESFGEQFTGDASFGQFALSTSWRNGHRILSAANTLVEPLVAATRVQVEPLTPSPVATEFPIESLFVEDVRQEADAAALWLKDKLAASGGAKPPTAAMLFRARATQRFFIDALRRRGVPFHVLGIGGLVAEPEIADLVCALTVVSDPSAGSELVRLLAGPRWRIGVKDLHALSRVASWLRARDLAQQPYDDETNQKLRASVAEGEGGSIVDALDFVATATEGHSQLAAFSAVGVERLRDAGRTLAALRSRSTLDLVDFVTLVEQELMLDIETTANETRPLGSANMEAFLGALHDYLSVSEVAGLTGFLAWLREAEWRDGLSPRPEEPEPGTVQLLTIHGAKGLEWDHVVVPRLVEGDLPSRSKDGYNGWLAFGNLPYEFRGDAAELPTLDWRTATTRKEISDACKAFNADVREHSGLEERRLAYVAVTRARHTLLLTGSFWSTGSKKCEPSRFLRELAERATIGPLPEAPENDENPLGDEINLMVWPLDPLGGRRPTLERAADLVRAARPGAAGQWESYLDLLLEERRRLEQAGGLTELPVRISASRFKDYVTDPASVAEELRRPMPSRPYRATRLGTLFHSWVEERSGLGASSELIDSLDFGLDPDDVGVEQEQLARLQEIFERSPFANLKPVEVERELHLPFEDRIVICKIDAVYEQDGRFRVVDWKTGKAPKSAEDLELRQLQLALYRLAFARWKGIDPSLVDAVFYYVADDLILEPERIFDEEELRALWRRIAQPFAG